jgi:pimeloyl-ACP methyl ester carboxylesterase
MSAAGHHVLRFDYFGVGESAGASEEGDLEGWRDDIETAVEELKSMAGTPRVSLVGLRLGGTLAAEVATRRGDIEALALWDPVVSGRGYLDELDAEHAAWLAERTRYVPFPPTDVPNRVCHAFPRNLESQVAAIDLKALAPKLRQKVLLVITESLRTHEAFMAAFPLATRSRMTVERVTDRPPWRLDTMGFGGPLPRDALKRIVEWIG